MNSEIDISADKVALFCRLQMNIKRDIPIRRSEMGVLIYIQKQSGSVTPLMVSNFFMITKPSVTSMINRLIKKDYLIKTPSTQDGRSYIISITPKGRMLVKDAYIENFKSMELLRKRMGNKEYNMFINFIDKANNILLEEM